MSIGVYLCCHNTCDIVIIAWTNARPVILKKLHQKESQDKWWRYHFHNAKPVHNAKFKENTDNETDILEDVLDLMEKPYQPHYSDISDDEFIASGHQMEVTASLSEPSRFHEPKSDLVIAELQYKS